MKGWPGLATGDLEGAETSTLFILVVWVSLAAHLAITTDVRVFFLPV